jgi:hypothetical protein
MSEMKSSTNTQPQSEKGFYEAYASFARTLRAWLIAFGIGAPLIFFQNENAWAALGLHGVVKSFVYCFLLAHCKCP